LTLEISGYGTTLPVFSGEKDAGSFLRGILDRDGRGDLEVAYTDRTQLVLALLGPLEGVDRIAFDPLPEPHLSETVRLSGLGRRAFLDSLLGRGRSWSASPDQTGGLGTHEARPPGREPRHYAGTSTTDWGRSSETV